MKNHYRQSLFIKVRKEFFKGAPFLLFSLLLIFQSQALAREQQAIKQFLNHTFINEIPNPKRVWINKENESIIKSQFNPSQIKLSYRYWQNEKLTVWVLDEIGKERNITTAIVIEGDTIKNVKVLVYRESRGGQVQNDRFTRQYYNKNSQSNLIKEIDSISGATLSVNALNKQAKLALWLNKLKNES